jgi:hypothetical protein
MITLMKVTNQRITDTSHIEVTMQGCDRNGKHIGHAYFTLTVDQDTANKGFPLGQVKQLEVPLFGYSEVR